MALLCARQFDAIAPNPHHHIWLAAKAAQATGKLAMSLLRIAKRWPESLDLLRKPFCLTCVVSSPNQGDDHADEVGNSR
ncbi:MULTISPECIES: hypothetical protein [unclassified Mesorhizobium]|uniref:hypothetical protein n=1 Tax=unclassified Mesorhizobium TaxID=325217 RepID=UPI000FCA7544|nr:MULTISPECIES: hypothetical protein [unclassified Mesorhizobium]RUU62782.1 hypothetical protein EOC99_17030 [Mesorhizobium sp. M7A.T.Ca.TU.009.01.1.1]RUU85137.1 hypothetical protein EOD03_10420 [Mesorhizobium sp. M7A.T.Ca.TU.009.01.1.2]RUT80985.1 hypothetical protein EOD15_33835 [Mesorhizobium sp. M7A.T.Ca.US.000.02.2.1]RUT81636.1 hypothetical protein EOD14_29985 [Mesorhizobium sp. M7A.T.Ca.US.000.02.1.1]RUU02328.1 hypothetical protein EOD12_13590 [Mesorhizobium sp. M7A.T.Ca.TU.009.02.1.1]